MRRFAVFLAAVGLAVTAHAEASSYETILKKNPALPVTSFNITFRVGSADDPAGSEGLAYLTARLMRQGGLKKWKNLPARTREELEDYLFPMAADIDYDVGKEQISFYVSSTAEDSGRVFDILSQMIVAPEFSEKEFERLKSEQLDFLTKQAPNENQEELGKAALDRAIYGEKHPYAHVRQGRVAAVKKLTVQSIKEFYSARFTRKRLTVGLAGAISPELAQKAKTVFVELPAGVVDRAALPLLEPASQSLLIVKANFPAVGVHLGHTVGFNRASPAFPAMYFMSSAFGKHRTFVGRLMLKVREIRGLNYGTYAYVEDFPHGAALMVEPTQAARVQQAFKIWGRPTPPETGCFLLRQLAYEATSLHDKGLTAEEFKLGKSHLYGFFPLLGASLDRQLGYAIDSDFYGIQGDYLKMMQAKTKQLTHPGINALIKKHIHPKQLQMVVVTSDPEKFIEQILSPRCNVVYAKGVTHSKEVLAEDEKIATFNLGLKREQIRIVDAASLF